MTRFVEGEVEVQSIRKLIDLGIIPVLHGDVVFDSKKGVRIMSGDEIVIKTAELLKADQVIFVTNGDGLFDPENAGKTISEIDRLELIKIKEKLTHQTDGVDVTKGFLGKIEWCTGFTPVQGIRIIDGMNSENLRRGLLDNHGGTLISPA
jgi:isopentenyl phosphate kinase